MVADAPRRRKVTLQMPRTWHRRIHAGIALDRRFPPGTFRGEATQSEQVDVAVGRVPAVPHQDIVAQLATFNVELGRQIAALDGKVPGAAYGADELLEILRVAAYAHGEWVRIHPFVDGNGRTARCWVLWCSFRYGLPAFMNLRPRPQGQSYASAAMASMETGDHSAMHEWLLDELHHWSTTAASRR